MRESQMRAIIKKHFTKKGVFIQAIESHGTPGVPDIFFHDEESGWAELKEMKGLRVPFRPGQFNWLQRYWKSGGLSLLIVTTPKGLWYVFQGPEIKREYESEHDMFLSATWTGTELPESAFCRC